MSLDRVIRDAVKTVDSVTKSLQTEISLSRWISQTYDGIPTYAAPMTLRAIVEYRQEQRQSKNGQTRVSKAYVVILDPIDAHGAANRSEPIDERDLITLSNLDTGPILEIAGFVDPKSGEQFYYEIWMGDRRGDI